MEPISKSDAWRSFENENVISLETYRKNGDPVRTPVWFIIENGTFYVHTGVRSGKVKRIRRNPKVRIAPSSFRGTPKADYIDAQAEIERDPQTVESYYSRIYKKYGLQGTFTKFVQGITGLFSRDKTTDVVIVIRPS